MASKTPQQPTAFKTSMEIIRTSRHEQASAMLWSLLLLVGMVTTGLFVAWMSTSIVWNRPIAQVTVEDVGGGSSGGNRTGKEKELVEPGTEEMKEGVVAERVEPVLE